MSGFELEHQRDKPPARVRTRQVSRSVLDDVGNWWNGEPNFRVRHEKPEKPFTKQDFDQTLSLVFQPVSISHMEIFGKKPDAAVAKTASGRLSTAISALQVIAGSKRDEKNKQGILAPLPDIQSAQTTLQVMGDNENAPSIWKGAFGIALDTLETVIALPVIDPDADTADPPPANGVEQRDHDLLVASVRPTLQRLIETTSRMPWASWDPRSYTEGNEALGALSSISHPHLKPAVDAVKRGMDAITTYAKNEEDRVKEASDKLETAMQKIAQMQEPHMNDVVAEVQEKEAAQP
jgi:hypothetical protein